MEIQTGYLYHIKDEFFNKINDKGLMTNHENGHARPTYFTIKANDILWFIPLSSKVAKYQNIINHKINKYGNAGPNLSYEARKSQINKVSNRILDTYDNSMIIGYKNVLNKLLEEG